MKKYLLEICVDSYESARRASENGADRLELCGDLLVGGVSPSPFLIEQVAQRIKTPVNVLLENILQKCHTIIMEKSKVS